MKNSKLLALIMLLFTMLACETPMAIQVWREKGDITIVAPEMGARYHDEDTSVARQIEVSIQSTFAQAKDAILTVNGTNQSPCRLEPNFKNICRVPIQIGQNVILVEVYKVDQKTIVSDEITVHWTPYTPMDKAMIMISKVFGSQDPLPGYGTIIFLVACLAALGIGKIFGSQWGSILAFFMSLIGLAVYLQQSGATLLVGQVLALIYGIFAAAMVVLVLITWINSKKSIRIAPKVNVVKKANGDLDITASEWFYLGDTDSGLDAARITDAATRLPSPVDYLPQVESLPLLGKPAKKRKTLLGWKL